MNEIDREAFRKLLGELAGLRMPFGKYGPAALPPRGMPVYDLPEEYLLWFKERGFPKGRLGELMAVVCGVKEAGMDSVFDPLREANGGRVSVRPKRRREVDFPDS